MSFYPACALRALGLLLSKEIVSAADGGGAILQQALERVSLTGSSSINFLKEALQTQAGKQLADQAQKRGQQIILNGSGELIERLMQGMKGGITW